MDLVLGESVGLKALSILIYYFFVFDSALVSVWDLAFIVIDVVHVLNYLHCEKHFNACLLLKGSWNTRRGKENKPHHIKHIKHVFLAKPRCRDTAEISEQLSDGLLCLHGAEDMGYGLTCWKHRSHVSAKLLLTLICRYSMELPSLGRLQAGETIELLDPDSVRPLGLSCTGGMYSFSLRLNSYILWLGWAARPVQRLHGVHSLHCLMKDQVSYWWPPKRQRGKKKSTLLSILWITSFGYWYPLKVACPGSQRVTGHRHSWSIHTTVFLTQLVADPRLLHL